MLQSPRFSSLCGVLENRPVVVGKLVKGQDNAPLRPENTIHLAKVDVAFLVPEVRKDGKHGNHVGAAIISRDSQFFYLLEPECGRGSFLRKIEQLWHHISSKITTGKAIRGKLCCKTP